MRIIKNGKPKTSYLITCENCNCEFLINEKEMYWTSGKFRVLACKCPWCSEELSFEQGGNCTYQTIYHY